MQKFGTVSHRHPLAGMGPHLTLNQGVQGSNPLHTHQLFQGARLYSRHVQSFGLFKLSSSGTNIATPVGYCTKNRRPFPEGRTPRGRA